MSRRVDERQTARLGRTVRLPCPVEGDPPPLILWVKDGRNVNQGYSRYRVLKQSLKIKEVEMEDAGVYICRVTNGFGSIALNFTLIVIGEKDSDPMLKTSSQRCQLALERKKENTAPINLYISIFSISKSVKSPEL